jgi:hypothetical protein
MITLVYDRVAAQLFKYTFAFNPIPFIATSTYSNRKNFKFIYRTYIDNANVTPVASELVNENKVYKAPTTGQGVFDASSILSQRLTYDFKYDATTLQDRNNSVKNYNIGIGEEFSREIIISSVQNSSGLLRLNFDTNHNLRVGDSIVILANDPQQFNQNVNVQITSLPSATSAVTNFTWAAGLTGLTGIAIEAEQFTDNYYSPIGGVEYVGFVFQNYGSGSTLRPTRFKVGDLVNIRQDTGFTYSSYNRQATVLLVDTVNIGGNNFDRVVVNIRWAGSSPANSGVMFSRNNYYLPDLLFTNTSTTRTYTYVVNGKLKHDVYPNFNYADFMPSGGTNRFLTNAPKSQNIIAGQYQTLAFLQGDSIGSDDVERAEITLYDTDGNYLTDIFFSNPDIGSTNRLKQSKVFGVGTQNIDDYLTSQMQPPIDWSGVSYYTVRLFDTTASPPSERSETLTFILDCNTRYKTNRVAFLNALGEFDYFNFKQGYSRTQTSELSTFRRRVGSVQSNVWNYSNEERGLTVFNSYAEESIVCNSGWLSKDESIWLKELLTSKEVYLFNDNNEPIPVVVVNTEIQEKVDIQVPLFRIEIEFKFANIEKY